MSCLALIGSRTTDVLCLKYVSMCNFAFMTARRDLAAMRAVSHRGVPDVTLGSSWEALPYLDRIWSLPRLSWEAQARLLEMHQAGVIDEGDLSPATLRSLNNSRLGCEPMDKVMSRCWNFASASQHSTGLTAGTAQQDALHRNNTLAIKRCISLQVPVLKCWM
jgi:hypothetical protein